jgi:hypothetical protein
MAGQIIEPGQGRGISRPKFRIAITWIPALHREPPSSNFTSIRERFETAQLTALNVAP